MNATAIQTLLRELPGLLRLRKGPQDLPPGWPIAALLASLLLIENIVSANRLSDESGVQRGLLAMTVQLVISIFLLRFKGLESRITQTVTALCAAGLVFALISDGLMSLANPDSPNPGLALAYLGLFAWSLSVDGHIYSQALSVKMRTGVLVAVLIFAVNFMLLTTLYAPSITGN